jgi:hypothetical protein
MVHALTARDLTKNAGAAFAACNSHTIERQLAFLYAMALSAEKLNHPFALTVWRSLPSCKRHDW